MTDVVVAEESAQNDFEMLIEAWDLDDGGLNEEEQDSFETIRRRIVRAICRGQAFFDSNTETLTYTLKYPFSESVPSLTFGVPKGNAVAAFDRFKQNQTSAKFNAYMGAMCGVDGKTFSKLDERDAKFCRAVAQLFLGS